MLGRRLRARALRHQRLARVLRVRYALAERRELARRRTAVRRRFLRPLAVSSFASDDELAVAAEPLAAAVEFVEEQEQTPDEVMSSATPATPTMPSTEPPATQSAEPADELPVTAPRAPATPHLAMPIRGPAAAEPPSGARVATPLTGLDAELASPASIGAPPAALEVAVVAPPAAPLDSEPAHAATERPASRRALTPAAVAAAAVAELLSVRAPSSAPVEERVARPPARFSARAETVAGASAPAPEPARAAADAANDAAHADSPPLSAPPEALDANALFTPSEPEARAPAAWLERLTRAAAQPNVAAPVASTTQPARRLLPLSDPAARRPAQSSMAPPLPEPDVVALSPSARRFLRPLLGVDPVDVLLRAGSDASRAVAAHAADALAFEGEVVLGAEAAQTLDAPATLGLLAHELTHVARRAAPRFVPPIARDTGVGSRAQPPTDEETLARRVEARVTRAAERGVDGSSLAAPVGHATPRRSVHGPLSRDTPTARGGLNPAVAPMRADVPAPFGASPTRPARLSADAESFDWGGLPAPWEPLPGWVTESLSVAVPRGNGAGLAPPQAAAGGGALSLASAPSAPFVQRAGEERSLATADGAPSATPARAPAAHAPPEPDLDDLARQVYTILRRRLAAEARRAG